MGYSGTNYYSSLPEHTLPCATTATAKHHLVDECIRPLCCLEYRPRLLIKEVEQQMLTGAAKILPSQKRRSFQLMHKICEEH